MKIKKIVFLLVIVVFSGLFFHNQKILDPTLHEDVQHSPHEEFIQEQPQDIGKEEAKASITVEECQKLLQHLAGNIGVRVSGTPAYEEKAAPWAKAFFENHGLKTEYQNVPIIKKYSKNVFAWIEGSNPNEIIVVGGHLDTVPKSPGADDNGSGSVAVMMLARAFSMVFQNDKPPRTILFQLYAAEEMGLIGSRYYCNNPTFPRNDPDIKKHIYMLNFDMIGRAKYGDILEPIIRGGSDHISFRNKGIPAEMYHTGIHQYYHTPFDTSDKINYEGMVLIIKKGFDKIWDKVYNGHNEHNVVSHQLITHDHEVGDKFIFGDN
jgi:hypothetical protein